MTYLVHRWAARLLYHVPCSPLGCTVGLLYHVRRWAAPLGCFTLFTVGLHRWVALPCSPLGCTVGLFYLVPCSPLGCTVGLLRWDIATGTFFHPTSHSARLVCTEQACWLRDGLAHEGTQTTIPQHLRRDARCRKDQGSRDGKERNETRRRAEPDLPKGVVGPYVGRRQQFINLMPIPSHQTSIKAST